MYPVQIVSTHLYLKAVSLEQLLEAENASITHPRTQERNKEFPIAWVWLAG